ncbi:hypothetical protein GPJ56_007986 [Histomonas meleagridis]|uniref:uncharacterized protein n=1 Tax=Histomonas meleagridis TaxID=135588 RepID=UPI0035594D77|nr:hypothetical protein GPJ56_007986 [Histomonas meleagridis]KAH0803928.1 hypothetical protein GO595_002758 [Histomonas meleagridis]
MVSKTEEVYNYLLGGLLTTNIVIMVCTLGYNAYYNDHNSFSTLKYGQDQKVSDIAIAIVVLSAISAVAMLLYLFVYLFDLSTLFKLILLVIAILTFLGTLLAQIIGESYTMYGNSLISSIHSYYDNNEDFQTYVNENYHVGDSAYDFSLPETNSSVSYDPSLFGDFIVSYRYYDNGMYRTGRVPSCRFENITLDLISGGSSQTASLGPCFYDFSNVEGTCVGRWSAEDFGQYWCYLVTIHDEKLAQPTIPDQIKYQAEMDRNHYGYGTFANFYSLNALFIIIEVIDILLLLALMIVNTAIEFCKPKKQKEEPKKEQKKKPEPKKEPVVKPEPKKEVVKSSPVKPMISLDISSDTSSNENISSSSSSSTTTTSSEDTLDSSPDYVYEEEIEEDEIEEEIIEEEYYEYDDESTSSGSSSSSTDESTSSN